MANFINTIDVLGDDAVIDSIINRTIHEYKDENVKTVGTYAFYGCTALETVDVPNATKICTCAFSNCTALKSFDFTNVETIDSYAFNGCSTIKEICCPKVTNDLWYTFVLCSGLEKADLSAVKKLGSDVFRDTAITALILRSSTICTLNHTNTFLRTPIASGGGYIYVPSALYDSYKSASNWSTYANQFRKLEEWTVDGTVTGQLATNRHMVRFFNSDGTLLGYKVVTTGSTATWDGATPVDPSGNGYPFEGWSPAPTNVRADMDCYPQFENPVQVAEITDSWEQIMAAVADGTAGTKYKVGNYKPMDLGAEGIINMQIIGKNKDTLADGSGTATLTWLSKELLATKHRMNPGYEQNDDGTYQEGTGTIGGWEKCEMRAYLKETIKPLIPEVVRNSIKEVTKTQTAYNTNKYKFNQTSVEDVWLPDETEMSGSSSPYKTMFPDNASRIKTLVDTTSEMNWVLRSAKSYYEFALVIYAGSISYSHAYSTCYVAIGFCT